MNYVDPSGLSDCAPGEWWDCGDNFSWADFWGGDAQATRRMFFSNREPPDFGRLLAGGFGNGSGIWDEHLPPLVRLPYDPRLIIKNVLAVDQNGNVLGDPADLVLPPIVGIWYEGPWWRRASARSKINEAARTAARNWLIGEGVAAGVGCGVGALVAGGLTAATETWPLAGATVPAGCVGGGAIGAVDAFPYVTLGAIVEFSIDAWGVWRH